jgi:hypothetical protein
MVVWEWRARSARRLRQLRRHPAHMEDVDQGGRELSGAACCMGCAILERTRPKDL